MSKTFVVNMRHEPFEVRIDRATPYGNPFRIGRDGDRRKCIEKFKVWWLSPERAKLREKAKKELKGRVLGCWCKPSACHGDVITEYVDAD